MFPVVLYPCTFGTPIDQDVDPIQMIEATDQFDMKIGFIRFGKTKSSFIEETDLASVNFASCEDKISNEMFRIG